MNVTPTGQVLFTATALANPPEIASIGLDGNHFKRLTAVNEALMAKVDLGSSEDLTFRGCG